MKKVTLKGIKEWYSGFINKPIHDFDNQDTYITMVLFSYSRENSSEVGKNITNEKLVSMDSWIKDMLNKPDRLIFKNKKDNEES